MRGELQPDEPAADHHDVARRFERGPQPVGVLAGAQHQDAFEVGTGHRQRTVARASGQHHMVVPQLRTVLEPDFRRVPVDRGDPAADQLDVLLGEVVLRPQHQLLGARAARQVRLRQRRPLIRHPRLVPDQNHAAA